MTLSISDQPSQWHRRAGYPNRSSLLSDTTIDPFPSRGSRSASLLEHHIVRDRALEQHHYLSPETGRRSTVPCIPHRASLPSSGFGQRAEHQYSEEAYEIYHRKRTASMMADQEASESSSPASTGQVDGGQFCLCQPEPKIPRPRNGEQAVQAPMTRADNATAFILYRQHQQAEVVRRHPGLPNPAISKIIGEQWSQLREETKNEWKALAEVSQRILCSHPDKRHCTDHRNAQDEKARHAQQYPDYRYQPRRNGRYSSASSGSGQASGKVDQQGNCVKCGGKTMNPPTTPYAVSLARNDTTEMQSLTYAQAQQQRPSIVSPPRGAATPYPEQRWAQPMQRFEARPQYPMSPDAMREGHDLKRRRFDGGGIYIPTREAYHDPHYQYSPRGGAYMIADRPREILPPRSAAMMPGPPRVMYPQQPPLSRIQLARPPQPTQPTQHRRDPSLTLPPLTTPVVQQGRQDSAVQRAQNSGLEAMIMSIPVLNKIKILSQISPFLQAPSAASPPPPIRGAVIAVEGLDPTSVYSMTNSLAEQLEKDGKFAVRIFGGPDPYGAVDDVKGSGRKSLTFQDCLDLASEWHRISEEIKHYITTSPTGTQSDGVTPASQRSITMEDVPTARDKTPEKTVHIITPIENKDASMVDTSSQPNSAVSPHTIDKTADLSIATPPKQNFTRIPPGAQPPTTPTTSRHLDTLPPTTTPTTTTPTTASAPQPSLPSTLLRAPLSSTPIPIALVPHYQLTTVDSSSIAMPITDSYSPLAHWQWLATLWRGCVGADVTVVIRNADLAIGEDSPGTVARGVVARLGAQAQAQGSVATGMGGLSVGSVSGAVPTVSAGAGQGHEVKAAGDVRMGGTSVSAGAAGTPQNSVSAGAGGRGGDGQGIDVRLLDCRAVVVRTNIGAKKSSGLGVVAEGAEQQQQQMDVATEKEKRDGEFWEKAKRRVGFEVCEFLRR